MRAARGSRSRGVTQRGARVPWLDVPAELRAHHAS
jgi:hypothetical protein